MVRRSGGSIPRSLAESNGILSWRGAADDSAGVGRFHILLLLDGGRIAQEALSQAVLGQQLMELSQRRYGDARRAECHSGADRRIEHPCRQPDDQAGRHCDVNNHIAAAPLSKLAPKTAPIKCMPAIIDLNLLPDMGRMAGRSSTACANASALAGSASSPTVA